MFEVQTKRQSCYIRFLQFKQSPTGQKISDQVKKQRVVSSLMDLTDWIQQDLKYQEAVMGLQLIAIRICKFKEQGYYQIEWIPNVKEQFYYEFQRKRSFTDPCNMFQMLGYNEYHKSNIEERVLYNRRFQCSVHIHKTMPTRPNPKIKPACIIQIRQFAERDVNLKYGIGSQIEEKLRKDKVAEIYPINLPLDQVNRRLRPAILEVEKSGLN